MMLEASRENVSQLQGPMKCGQFDPRPASDRFGVPEEFSEMEYSTVSPQMQGSREGFDDAGYRQHVRVPYSYRRAATGLARAARIEWVLTVSNAMSSASPPAAGNSQTARST